MRPKKASKLSIRIDSKDGRGKETNVTEFVQLTNSSKKDSMSAVDFVYDDVSASKKRIRIANKLQPQQVVKVDFAKVGISAQVVSFHTEWQFQGIEYGSHVVTAKPGSYFYSLEISLKPDGSSETDWLVQRPL